MKKQQLSGNDRDTGETLTFARRSAVYRIPWRCEDNCLAGI